LGFAGLFVIFFRDPDRRLTPSASAVYAAADGVVTSIEQDVADAWLPNGAGTRIAMAGTLARFGAAWSEQMSAARMDCLREPGARCRRPG
jgi:hypothetical protein